MKGLGRAGLVLAVSLMALGVMASEPALSDADLEVALSTGEVVNIEQIGTGVTQPERVTIVWQDHTIRAALKTLDLHRNKQTRFARGRERLTLSFTDSYLYERAAYLLDRRLGLRMVPVAVIRDVGKRPGALVFWIEDAITENDRLEQHLTTDDPILLSRQRSAMRLFDALIQNVDRNQGNSLYTPPEWRLHLIDHTRAFRLSKDLDPKFKDLPVALSGALWEQLRSLKQEGLERLFKGLLTHEQVKYLIRRRDAIVEKIEKDIEAYGESVVLY